MKSNTALKADTKPERKVQRKAPSRAGSKTASKTANKTANKVASKTTIKKTGKAKVKEEKKKALSKTELTQLSDFVVDQIMMGSEKAPIYDTLVEMGASKQIAKQFVDEVHSHILESAKKEQPTTGLIIAASIGSLIAALIGGVLWGFLVNATGYEIGFMAWAVGVMCGFASMWSAKGRKGRAIQIIAIVSSLTGILIGKYVTFFYLLRDVVVGKYGVDAASKVAILSWKVVHSFITSVGAVVSWLDILWVGLAIFAAWEIPKGLGIKVAKEPATVSSTRSAV